MKDKEWKSLILKSMILLFTVVILCIMFSCGVIGNDKIKARAGREGKPEGDPVFENNAEVKKERISDSELEKLRKASGKVMVIDAGHGGNDDGAVTGRGKLNEKDYTLRVVKELKKLLDKTDITVYYTRLDDIGLSKRKRINLANKLNADMFISIHCNASDNRTDTAHGVEALYSKRYSRNEKITNKKLASLLANNVSKIMDSKNRGIKQREELYLMRHSKVPASIIEIGYLTDKSDLKYISKKSGRRKIARGIYNAIEQAYGLLK